MIYGNKFLAPEYMSVNECFNRIVDDLSNYNNILTSIDESYIVEGKIGDAIKKVLTSILDAVSKLFRKIFPALYKLIQRVITAINNMGKGKDDKIIYRGKESLLACTMKPEFKENCNKLIEVSKNIMSAKQIQNVIGNETNGAQKINSKVQGNIVSEYSEDVNKLSLYFSEDKKVKKYVDLLVIDNNDGSYNFYNKYIDKLKNIIKDMDSSSAVLSNMEIVLKQMIKSVDKFDENVISMAKSLSKLFSRANAAYYGAVKINTLGLRYIYTGGTKKGEDFFKLADEVEKMFKEDEFYEVEKMIKDN